jgi:hypothetical protein
LFRHNRALKFVLRGQYYALLNSLDNLNLQFLHSQYLYYIAWIFRQVIGVFQVMPQPL